MQSPPTTNDMHEPTDSGSPTRMLFLGEASLADGFRLIGFETFTDPSEEQVEHIFLQLRQSRDKAFVIVDDALMRRGAQNLDQVRNEGGRIIVISVPGLTDPPRLTSEVADRLAAMFGGSSVISSGVP
jgi:vacuolar-type H+-ATPase subunit F/Vma7